MKVLRWLDDHLEETAMIVLLVMITCVSFMQVIIRKVPFIPALTWAEEFCRFCWIWSVFLSLPYTIRRGIMMRVNVLTDLMPDTMRKVLNLIVEVVTTACMALLAVYSVTVVSDIRASHEASPAMLWPMWVIYSMMLIGFALATVRGLQQIYFHIKNFSEHDKTLHEQMLEEAREEAALAMEAAQAQAEADSEADCEEALAEGGAD